MSSPSTMRIETQDINKEQAIETGCGKSRARALPCRTIRRQR